MTPPETIDVTTLLHRMRAGDSDAEARVYDALYHDLRREAARQLRGQRVGHTLQATALLHEAYLRVARNPDLTLRERGHFRALVSRAMRCALIDHARARLAKKRGAGAVRNSLHRTECVSDEGGVGMIELSDALERLSAVDPVSARVVDLRFFGGFSIAEIAECLDVSTRTVERRWDFARSFLHRELA